MTTVIRRMFFWDGHLFNYKRTSSARNVPCLKFVKIILFWTLHPKDKIFTDQKQCALFDAEARRRFVWETPQMDALWTAAAANCSLA